MNIVIEEKLINKGVTPALIKNMMRATNKAMPAIMHIDEQYFKFLAFEALLAEENKGRRVTLWKDMLKE